MTDANRPGSPGLEQIFYDAVKAAVLEFLERNPQTIMPAGSVPERPLDYSAFPPKVRKILDRAGVRTVEDVLAMGRQGMGRVRSCGEKSLRIIDDHMREIGEADSWGIGNDESER